MLTYEDEFITDSIDDDVIETIENITITLILHTPTSNIRSIGHALNLRRFGSSQKRED